MLNLKKQFLTGVILYTFGIGLSISNATPPPPPDISEYNKISYDEGERRLDAYSGSELEVRAGPDPYVLESDLSVDRVVFTSSGSPNMYPNLQIKDATLTIGKGGVVVDAGAGLSGSSSRSRIDSTEDYIDFHFKNEAYFNIGNITIGSLNHKVGMRVLGCGGIIYNGVNVSDGFQLYGDLIVDSSTIFLEYKSSVSGDVYVSNGRGIVINANIGFFSPTSNVNLNNSGIQIDNSGRPILEYIHSITVEGVSSISFAGYESGGHRLFLEDLFITEGSVLRITGQVLAGSVFVRKDSAHLHESLSRITIGRDGKAELRDYDKDYWEIISNLPEPATYGAVLGAVGVGLIVWRKRRRMPEGKAAAYAS